MELASAQPTRIEVGLTKLDDGLQAVKAAIDLAGDLALPGEPERRARAALVVLRSAVDWLEDTKHFARAHKALDWAGSKVRRTFGCRLEFHPDRGYAQTCPVALAHARVGMSAAIIIRESECSICGQDPEDCEHISGRIYNGERCHRIVTRADDDHIAVVSRPNLFDARITHMSVDVDEIREKVGPDFFYGTPVSCDACLKTCPGMSEVDLDSSSG